MALWSHLRNFYQFSNLSFAFTGLKEHFFTIPLLLLGLFFFPLPILCIHQIIQWGGTGKWSIQKTEFQIQVKIPDQVPERLSGLKCLSCHTAVASSILDAIVLMISQNTPRNNTCPQNKQQPLSPVRCCQNMKKKILVIQ